MEKSRDELLDGMTDLSLAEPFPDEVFYKIFEIEDHVERTQFVEALKNKAREMGRAKEFTNVLKSFFVDYQQRMKQTGNKTHFTEQPAELECGPWMTSDQGIFTEKMDSCLPVLTDYEGQEWTVPSEFYYMTCHREENTFSDAPLKEILSAMNELDAPTIYPVHPRNKERALRLVRENGYSQVKLVPPVKYSQSVWLTNHAKKIVTDSGGLQCEAFFAGKQCVTVFHYKVWPETLVGNRNQLCEPRKEEILKKLAAEQVIDENYRPFGDGNTAERIVQLIKTKL